MQEAGSQSADLPPLAAGIRRGEGGDGQATQGAGEGNTQLKKLVANQALDLSILKEVAEGKW